MLHSSNHANYGENGARHYLPRSNRISDFPSLGTCAVLLCALLTACDGGSGGGSGVAHAAEPEISEVSLNTVAVSQTDAREYQHIIVLGDSIMFWSTDGPRTTTAHLIAQDHDTYITNLSQSGQTMAAAVRLELWNMVEFLVDKPSADKTGETARALVVQLGHNDWFGQSSYPEKFRENYRVFLTRTLDLNVDVYCVVPIRALWDSEHRLNGAGLLYEDVRNVVRELAGEELCSLIETNDWFSDSDVFDGYTMPDGLHLGRRGHLIFTNRLMAALQSAID